MSLTHEETSALSALQTIVTALQEVAELRSTNANLSAQYAEDQTTIATLLGTRHSLESTLAEVRQALTEALNRESQLRIDLAETQSRLVDEQRLAGQHWNDLQTTRTTLTEVESNLHATIFDRNRTAAKLTEAEDKLTRFRDILGISHPVEPVSSPEPVEVAPSAPVETPVPMDHPPVVIPLPTNYTDTLVSETKAIPTLEEVVLPDYPFTKEAETTVNPTSPDFDSQSGFYRYP